MRFIADLHIHSRHSRATSQDLTFLNLYKWALYKGIQVVGTGDFTHGAWIEEMASYLEEAPEPGLYRLQEKYAAEAEQGFRTASAAPVRFLLSVEISSIYKKNGRVRKVHNIVFAPNLEVAQKIRARLRQIGNIDSDGRPILGLDSEHLLEILLSISPDIYLIPAHIWTPWFSVLGSKSGFDQIEECFGDLTKYIFALETGLSSDPAMNWMCSFLDRFTLVSNSDAHSASKLGREANLFDTDLSYQALFDALKTKEGFLGTVEFYPEEGKYHLDGHRKCNVRLTPEQSLENKGICPVCEKPLTLGVAYRVMELADRKWGQKPEKAAPFRSLIGLETILSEVLEVGPTSKKLEREYLETLASCGPELEILANVPISELAQKKTPLFAEAVRRTREGELQIEAGYDGEYGKIQIFQPGEKDQFLSQASFFGWTQEPIVKKLTPTIETYDSASFSQQAQETQEKFSPRPTPEAAENGLSHVPPTPAESFNEAQREVIFHKRGALLVAAGPGTGKTKTLVSRIAHAIETQGVSPSQILAITFTNKAAEEMQSRLQSLLGKKATSIMVCTFHKFGWKILEECAEDFGIASDFTVYGEREIRAMFGNTRKIPEAWFMGISQAKNALEPPENFQNPELRAFWEEYHSLLAQNRALDVDDLIYLPVKLLSTHPSIQEQLRQRFTLVAVDEYQDINEAQHRLLPLLLSEKTDFLAIGDPDQAIYGFRGARVEYFFQFSQDFPSAQSLSLTQNYRSSHNIVEGAMQVISHNLKRLPTKLQTQKPGEKIQIYEAASDKAEAEFVVHTIEELLGGTRLFSFDSGRADQESVSTYSFGNFAILYRTNLQNKTLTEALDRSSMPYQIVGGPSFWQEKAPHFKNLLQVLDNPSRNASLEALLRALPNVGKKSIDGLREYAKQKEISSYDALREARQIPHLAPAALLAFSELGAILECFHKSSLPLGEWLRALLEATSVSLFPQESKTKAAILEAALPCSNLRDFLSTISLQEHTTEWDPRVEKVALMTLHAAKGLEFPVVFIVGCEENFLPYRRFGAEKEKEPEQALFEEEERRLFYVGMTRAEELLYLTHAKKRLLFGKEERNPASRYLTEIPPSVSHRIQNTYKHPPSAPEGKQMSFF